jgi:ATP-dependent helicase HepA
VAFTFVLGRLFENSGEALVAPAPMSSQHTSAIQIGNHVVHRDQPSWGVGRVVALSKDGLRLAVRFSGRPREELQVSARDGAVLRYRFQVGDEVRVRADGDRIVKAVVREVVRGPLDTVVVELDDGTRKDVPEKGVASQPPPSGVIEDLARGAWDEARNYLLRQSTLRLDVERRCDGLGALFASRVMVKPYQVGVAQRVLSDRSPRYVLADEVGLGKTIEAGMILSALLHSKLARRVLVVAPSHLAVQWLAELWHKFNLRFTLLDADRLSAYAKEAPGEDPWRQHDLVVTSLELLTRSPIAREGAADADNRWDLVIFDEAHHLRGDLAYEVAIGLSTNTWGLLLLTATPMKLDPEEYYRLLRLVESAPAQSIEEFERRLARQKDLTAFVRTLEEASDAEVAKKAQALAKLFPKDKELASLAKEIAKDPEARDRLLDHIAEVYSLSARLIRNRRAVVGGFTERRLHRVDVTLDREAAELHRDVHAAIQDALKGGTLPQGAPLALLLRRLDSSPVALAKALEARPEAAMKMLAKRAQAQAGYARDAKLRALRDRLKEIDRTDPGSKILIFTESRETLEYLVAELAREGFAPLWYHGELQTLERDRMVARFRDPEGARVLISTEAGGEGRNFQFCHYLFHYDLPWSPSAIEQRIGRLDRVGQKRPVEIFVLRPLGTFSERVVDLFAEDVQVFTQTVGGLDAVLEEVEGELTTLATFGGEQAWKEYARKLSKAVRAAREAIHEDYDPLLDRRSFDRDRVVAMLERAYQRFGIDEEPEFEAVADIEEGLWTVARDLDERLEETVLSIARKVGISVDTDEHVEAFQCRLTLGSSMLVDGLAGVDLSEEKVIEGTFWRDTAVELEEIEYLATGHPVVESLMNHVRDGELGRSSVVRIRGSKSPAVGAVFSFLVQLPEAEDLAMGSHVPSRQAERLLDSVLLRVGVELGTDGVAHVSDNLVDMLDDAERAQTVKPTDMPVSGARWEQVLGALESAARTEAQSRLVKSAKAAIGRLDRELIKRLERLELDAERGDQQERVLRAAEMVQEQQFADAVRGALQSCRLQLDSACVAFVEPAAGSASTRGTLRRGERA